jgi:RimJ/RimL family protein N-acetyltransferase
MPNFKKHYNVIIVLSALFLSASTVFSYAFVTEKTLRVQIGQQSDLFPRILEIMAKNNEKIFIKLLDPNEYHEYSLILMQVAMEELKDDDKTKDSPMTEFLYISERLGAVAMKEDPDTLAFFMATNAKGEVVGTIGLHNEYAKEVGIKVPTIMSGVRKKYQGKGIGTSLKETAFKWMIKEGYDKTVVVISTDNKVNLAALKKACDNLGLTIEHLMNSIKQWKKRSIVTSLV